MNLKKIRLNQKGYLLVEIVLASVLAMSIAYYLLNLTYKFKNTNEDIYQSIGYDSTKNLIIKNILNDIEGKNISFVQYGSDSNGNDYVEFRNQCMATRLTIRKEAGKSTLVYGRYSNGGYNQNDVSYYEKAIPDSLMLGSLMVKNTNDILEIKIPITSMYSDEDYSIKLLISKRAKYGMDVSFKVDGNIYDYGYPDNGSQIQFAIKVNGEDKGYFSDLCEWYNSGVNWQIYEVKVNDVIQTISPIDVSIGSNSKHLYLNFVTIEGQITYQNYALLDETFG